MNNQSCHPQFLDPDALMDECQAAQMLGYTTRALQKWRRTGAGPKFIRISCRSIRYRRRDIIDWIEEKTRSNTYDVG